MQYKKLYILFLYLFYIILLLLYNRRSFDELTTKIYYLYIIGICYYLYIPK